MTMRTGVATFTRDEIEELNAPANRRVRSLVVGSLSLLGDLVRRYTGSMFMVQFPEEEVALRLLHRRLEALREYEPYWRRMAETVECYWRVRRVFEMHGPVPGVFELAQATTDDLVDAWSSITQYPHRIAAMNRLRPSKRRRATG
jgi:hypothetical protein